MHSNSSNEYESTNHGDRRNSNSQLPPKPPNGGGGDSKRSIKSSRSKNNVEYQEHQSSRDDIDPDKVDEIKGSLQKSGIFGGRRSGSTTPTNGASRPTTPGGSRPRKLSNFFW